MTFTGKFVTAALAAALTSGASLPASSASNPVPAPAPAPVAVELPETTAPDASVLPAIVAPAPVPAMAPIPDEAPALVPRRAAATEMDGELECLAKVVLHEAGNQSRAGQVAVAEVVMNRLHDQRRRFGSSICGVVMQRGQFFNVHAYRPYRDPRWSRVVDIARQVREDFGEGDHDPVTNGALFFRASYGAPFRGRTRVATIGDHAFYR